jgi:hypothetical protein
MDRRGDPSPEILSVVILIGRSLGRGSPECTDTMLESTV